MDRISRQQMLMLMAEAAAMRSTCFRGNTGALIAINNRPISIGYNGPPSGEPHCQGDTCELTKDGGCKRSNHAEHNAIEFVKRYEIRATELLVYSDLYSTSFPCPVCVSKIVGVGIKRLFYRHPYRDEAGLDMLLTVADVYRVTPSGYIVEEGTNLIIDPETLR